MMRVIIVGNNIDFGANRAAGHAATFKWLTRGGANSGAAQEERP
jgi:hypothetical protein